MSRRRAVLAALGLVAVALAGAAAAVVARRTALAEGLLVEALAARGVAPATLRVVRVDLHGIALADVAIGPPEAPDLALAHAEADWSLAALRARRLDALRVAGLRVRAALGEDGLSLGALDPLFAGAESDAPPVLPAPVLALEDARLALATPQGPAAGTASGALRQAADGALDGAFALALEHPLGRVRGDVTLAGPPADLAFEAQLADDAGRLSASAAGRADLVARSVDLEWRLAPLAFAPGALQPAALAPPLAKLGVADVSGRVEARGRATLAAGGALAYAADVAVRELSFATPLARVERASGALAFVGPPLRTPRAQLVSIALVDVGVPLADGLVEGSLRRDGRLALRRVRFAFSGGELWAEDVVLDPRRAPDTTLVLRARDVDLAQLLERTRLEGLSGTGRIEGEVPLTAQAGSVRVAGGLLRATPEGGTIRYRPSASVAATAAARPHDLGLAIGAFSDFRYDRLEARLDGALDGELAIALDVRGANPGFQDGRPVELHLNLEAHVADLVRSGRAAYRVPEAVEERLRAFSRGGSP